ncbi:cyanophycinase [Deinococcus cellulosilyticus]|uniref:Cyanophycinase n=1 Tax=Deinococcus cellulosilyticus (strain DSM 18568 / NBRC 106333 / KACC 11606 / 5516J-15) TaxID=1223518 RepID=A0A511MVW1_DEIC1|nr:cyanophycinase [Deinococcus cellulosilyticus]GEM44723.1 hypothetical protein DC3_03580 [Deinococcus cellulosilyticus NBRC 106333 = KACC 11606]
MIRHRYAITLLLLALQPAYATGNLLIVGGGLRNDNAPIYNTFIEKAGGKDQAKIVIFPTASSSLSSSKRFKADLEARGLKPENVVVLDLTTRNFETQNKNPDLVGQIDAATGVWFVGGDQARIAKALINKDGTDSPALSAVKKLYLNRDGVIGGTSAGASIQSALMPSSFGIPMDTLDYGIAPRLDMRGVNISRGLGFFTAGIVDQHFNTYDGRHARMARYLIETKTPYGYGIEENTAMLVGPDGKINVLGFSGVTLMDASKATLKDAALGVTINNIDLTYLQTGDSYDPATKTVTINAAKSLIAPGDEYGNGNRLVTDLSQPNAITQLITYGLVDNTATQAKGLFLRYNGNYSYGYEVTFSKTPETQGFYGSVAGVDGYAFKHVRMDLEPITGNRMAPEGPADLNRTQYPTEVSAVAFRGILPPDQNGKFNPRLKLTRGELAGALTYLTLATPDKPVDLTDVAKDNASWADIQSAISFKFMAPQGTEFMPDVPVSRADFAQALFEAYDLYQQMGLKEADLSVSDASKIAEGQQKAVAAVLAAGLMMDKNGRFDPKGTVSREEAAYSLYRLVGFQF